SWQYAHSSIAIMHHIQGRSPLSSEPVLHNLNYFDQIKYLAKLNPGFYTPDVWPAHYQAMADELKDGKPLPMP
ncbi:MAG: hypothetical protein WA888_03115, partial [Burkholderiaceae bacterium]